MRYFCFLLIFFVLPVSVFAFETDSWPGEGVPVFSSNVSSLTLHAEPSLSSPVKKLKFRIGWKVVYDQSKVITLKSVTLTSKAPVENIWCGQRESLSIAAGEQVEYMQYRAEGFGTAVIRGKVCEIDLESGAFAGLEQQPEVEWWVRVVDKYNNPEGWLFVSKEQLDFLDRKF